MYKKIVTHWTQNLQLSAGCGEAVLCSVVAAVFWKDVIRSRMIIKYWKGAMLHSMNLASFFSGFEISCFIQFVGKVLCHTTRRRTISQLPLYNTGLI